MRPLLSAEFISAIHDLRTRPQFQDLAGARGQTLRGPKRKIPKGKQPLLHQTPNRSKFRQRIYKGAILPRAICSQTLLGLRSEFRSDFRRSQKSSGAHPRRRHRHLAPIDPRQNQYLERRPPKRAKNPTRNAIKGHRTLRRILHAGRGLPPTGQARPRHKSPAHGTGLSSPLALRL
jgi:hypothetical protein